MEQVGILIVAIVFALIALGVTAHFIKSMIPKSLHKPLKAAGKSGANGAFKLIGSFVRWLGR